MYKQRLDYTLVYIYVHNSWHSTHECSLWVKCWYLQSSRSLLLSRVVLEFLTCVALSWLVVVVQRLSSIFLFLASFPPFLGVLLALVLAVSFSEPSPVTQTFLLRLAPDSFSPPPLFRLTCFLFFWGESLACRESVRAGWQTIILKGKKKLQGALVCFGNALLKTWWLWFKSPVVNSLCILTSWHASH